MLDTRGLLDWKPAAGVHLHLDGMLPYADVRVVVAEPKFAVWRASPLSPGAIHGIVVVRAALEREACAALDNLCGVHDRVTKAAQ